MAYKFTYDDTYVGTLTYDEADFRLIIEAYRQLLAKIEAWRAAANRHGVSGSYYQQEVDLLERSIEFGEARLSESIGIVEIQGASVGRLQWTKAALLLESDRKVQEIEDKRRLGWPSTLLDALEDERRKIVRLAEGIQVSPAEILGEMTGGDSRGVAEAIGYDVRPREPEIEKNYNKEERPELSVDIAILVALDMELAAVLRSAGPWERHQVAGDIRTYYTSTTEAGLSVVAARASGMGQINAALLARDVIARFRPRKVILVGIAGGLGTEIGLGDIVVSDQVVDYEIGKVTPSGATPRWSVYRSDALLRERLLDHRDVSWLARIRAARPDGDKSASPTIHSGVVLSGNKIIADATAAGALAAVWSRATAIEMEASGIAAALDQSSDAPAFVMVKAICDSADASKNDFWQEYAAEVAAAFVASFVFGPLQPQHTRSRKAERELPTLSSTVAATIDFRALRLALSAAFDLRELKILVSDLGVDWDNIAGDIKDEKIVELLWYMNRRTRLDALIGLVREERPGLLDAYSPAPDKTTAQDADVL